MTPSLEQKLIECLDALENGEALDVILSRYPDDAAQLRPYLETAVQLDQLPIQPTVAAQTASKNAFLQQAAAMKAGSAVPFWKNWQQWFRLAAALAMFLVLFLAGFAYASTTAVPGDLLYNGKRFIEDIRLQMAPPLQKIELADRYNQERIAEINQLLAAGRTEDVSFYGFIEAVGDDTLTIAGLVVSLDENTEIEGDVAVGYFAEVNGRTQNNAVLATQIIIASPPPSEDTTPEPQPVTTPTTQFTATPTRTDTGTPTVTLTASPTVTVTPTSTATPSPTFTPSPTETAVPLPTLTPTAPPATPDDDNSNDDDDNGNDNSDDDDNSNDDDDNGNDNEDDNSNDDDDNSNHDDNSNDDDDSSDDDDDDSSDDDDDDSSDNNSND